MAISIHWGTKVIFVPKADLTLIQTSPEVRELDLNWFRLQLHALQDDEEGIWADDTHNHNTEVTLSGLTYARIVEVINGYTVQFEDGQYTVNCVGANHNISDVKVANQVSLIVNNAAGLITNAAIEFASFNGGVTVDEGSVYSGTLFPVGTAQRPVNNMSDALLIAQTRGFTVFYILGDITLGNSFDFTQFTFIGESMSRTTITVEPSANVNNCEFYECSLTGTLDGNSKVKDCLIYDLNYISGYVELCVLAGEISLDGGADAYFLDCWAGSRLGNPPTINLGGAGQSLVMQNFNGYVKWENKTGASDQANASLNAGWVYLDSTITAGYITIIGTGLVEDYSTGGTVNVDNVNNPNHIADHIMDEPIAEHQVIGSLGWQLSQNNTQIARMLGMSQENMYQDQCSYQIYQNQNFLTSARIRTYTDEASVGSTANVLATYLVTVTWNNDQMETYQVVKQ
jgi:hypothetical protein